MRHCPRHWTGSLLLGVLAASPACGEPGDCGLQTLLYSIPAAVEVIVPDLRYERGGAGDAWVLSWPVHLRLLDAGGAVLTEHSTVMGPRAELTAFVEPQLSLRADVAYRGLAGLRALGCLPIGSGFVGLIAESGGLIATTDGAGGFVGAGLALGLHFDRNFPYVALIGRQTWTSAGARNDVSIDLVMPFPIR